MLVWDGTGTREFVIQNNDNVKMHLYHTLGDSDKPLVFKIHGLASGSETPHNIAFTQALQDEGYPTLEVDATNSNNNASDGELHDFTMQRHVQDLHDAIHWVKSTKPEWLQNGIGLLGHSMGGYAVLKVASEMRDDVSFVASLSPVISGQKLIDAFKVSEPDQRDAWKLGNQYEEGRGSPYFKRGHIPAEKSFEWLMHDLQDISVALDMPIAFIVGENDDLTTLKDVREFYNSLPDPDPQTKFFSIQDADHCYRGSDGDLKSSSLSQEISKFLAEVQKQETPDMPLEEQHHDTCSL